MHQRRRRLLARGADAEIAPRDDDVATPGLHGKFRKDVFQAVLRNHIDAVLHIGAWRQRVGVHIVADMPYLVPDARIAHASTSRGSVMRPRSADAATV